jgi:hypothetical protein
LKRRSDRGDKSEGGGRVGKGEQGRRTLPDQGFSGAPEEPPQEDALRAPGSDVEQASKGGQEIPQKAEAR